MRRWRWQTAFIAVCTAVLCGCGSPGAATSSPATSTTLHATAANGLKLTLTMSPNPPTARKELSLRLVVSDGSAAFHPSSAWVSESMPGMSMPKMSVTLKPTGHGQFSGRTLLVMGGKWELLVHIVDGGRQETKAFFIQVKE